MGSGASKQAKQNEALHTYEVSIRTGDRWGSGTTSDVFVTLCGQDRRSKEESLDTLFKDDFEMGQTDTFTFRDTPVPKVESIELRRGRLGTDWFLAAISVKDKRPNVVEFPVLRWIKTDEVYRLIPYDTCLPQKDDRKDQRMSELIEKRKTYVYRKWWPDLPPETTLPPDDKFTITKKLGLGLTTLKLGAVTEIKDLTLVEFRSVEDIKSMYSFGFEVPRDTEKWHDDRKFAMQRLTGVNIRQISLCKDLPTKLGVTNEMLEPFLEGKTLPAALADKRIFIVDHKQLHNIQPGPGLTVCAPIALFYQQKNGTLIPIAIQLYQEKGADNPVFLPSDDEHTWILAKMWFNNADAQIHEAVAHLGMTHIFMEGVAVASDRQLSLSHPIYKLLKPHFLYLLAINSLAVTQLLNKPDGFLNITMTVGTDLGLEFIHRHRADWRLDVEGTLPNELKSRGVDDLKLLPDYYYREDALEVYDAIKRYVTDYVNIYYENEKDLIDDDEIQAWRAELTPEAPHGAGLNGVPGTDGKFTKKEELIITLTSVIFTCSVEHAAVNFPQYDEYAFPLNYPARLSGTPPKDKTTRTMDDVFKTLAKPKAVMNGNNIFTILSERSTLPLGEFEIDYIYDPKAKSVLNIFRTKLGQISKNVQRKKLKRKMPYDYLDPKQIPNAISI